jgi:hypothetical protein
MRSCAAERRTESRKVKREKLLELLDSAWAEFEDSYAGLSSEQMMIPRVTGEWSVRDMIAHVTWWEQEALKSLPILRDGGKWPRYSVTYGGIDAFNAMMTEQRRHLSLTEVLRQYDEVHGQLMDYVRAAPVGLIATETRFRRRIRLDAYGHYPVHSAAIRDWRARTMDGTRN